MANTVYVTEAAERHIIFCVDHDFDQRNCLIFCQKQHKNKA